MTDLVSEQTNLHPPLDAPPTPTLPIELSDATLVASVGVAAIARADVIRELAQETLGLSDADI